jgi:hypothetical protein
MARGAGMFVFTPAGSGLSEFALLGRGGRGFRGSLPRGRREHHLFFALDCLAGAIWYSTMRVFQTQRAWSLPHCSVVHNFVPSKGSSMVSTPEGFDMDANFLSVSHVFRPGDQGGWAVERVRRIRFPVRPQQYG